MQIIQIKNIATFAALTISTLTSNSLSNPIGVGECHQEEGSLKIYQDGRLEWQTVIWKTRVWMANIWHSTFHFKNSTGQVVSVAGPYDSPMVSEALAHYDWNIKVRYEADMYDQIAGVTQWSRS
ncbi:hypothetical protein BG003_001755 [Podila horticola]|nr:hypothetical protein BG003_001755 [Podila horticola]